MITGNKGEWSEIYVLLKLLGDGKIYAADENLKKIENMYFPILKVLREEFAGKQYEYVTSDDKGIVRIFLDDNLVHEYKDSDFKEKAVELYKAIINSGTASSFSVEKIEEFMKKIECKKLKSPAIQTENGGLGKTDITMQIHDFNTGSQPIRGFSIKSELGNMPTLLNPGQTTNFIYEVTGLNDEQIAAVNSIDTRNKIMDRMKAISNFGGKLEFSCVANETFESNMEIVDSKLPEILAQALVNSYFDNILTCSEIVKKLASENLLKVKSPESFYGAKFKKFLTAVALGMVPSKPWNGRDEANGGYIIVSKSGDVLAYHIYNRDSFEEYLLRTTGFERASTTRYGYAFLYKKNNKVFINLNMQIRFLR